MTPTASAAYARTVDQASALGLRLQSVAWPQYGLAALSRLNLFVAEAEAYVELEEVLEKDPQGFTPDLRRMLSWSARQSAPNLAKAHRTLETTAVKMRAELGASDAIMMPTTSGPVFSLDAPAPADQANLTALANILGSAAAAFPADFTSEGLPLSLQVISFSDQVSLALSAALSSNNITHRSQA